MIESGVKCSDRVHDLLGLLRVGHQATTLRGAGHQSLLFSNFPCRVAGGPSRDLFLDSELFTNLQVTFVSSSNGYLHDEVLAPSDELVFRVNNRLQEPEILSTNKSYGES